MYDSDQVQNAVKKISVDTGIPAFAISFVKNYVGEAETDLNIMILHLTALDRVMSSSVEQVEKKLNKQRMEKMYAGD